MLELKNINKIYKSKKSNDTNALNNINITFNKTGLVFILGKSGSGKSTLLNLLGGLDTPTSGEIIYKSKTFKDFKEKDYDEYRNSSVGFIFQEYNLIDKYDVFENINYALKLQGINDNNKVLEVLDKVGLKDYKSRKINELSGGQKQRIAIARALVKNPDIILADEPSGNLDSENSKIIFDILKELSKERLVIVVSHDRENALNYGDRIIELQDGNIVNDINRTIFVEDSNITNKTSTSHLPLKDKFMFSVKNLFGHKIKLVLSILLISFALSFFGFSVMQKYLNFNKETVRLINKFDTKYLNIMKLKRTNPECQIQGYYVDCSVQDEITEDDYNYLMNKNNIKLYKKHAFVDPSVSRNISFTRTLNADEWKDSSSYYSYKYGESFTELKKDEFNFKLIGNIPTNYEEVVIIKPFADFIIKYGINKDDGTLYKPNSYNDIVNDDIYLEFGYSRLKICGIIDDDLSEFEKLKNVKLMETKLEDQSEEIQLLIMKYRYLYPVYFYALDGFKDNIDLNFNKSFKGYINGFKELSINVYNDTEVYTKNGLESISNIKEDEIIIGIDYMDYLTKNSFSKELNEFIIKEKDKDGSIDSEVYKLEYIKKYLNDNDIIGKIFAISRDNQLVKFKIIGISTDDNYYIKESVIDKYLDRATVTDLYVLTKDINNYNEFFKAYPIDGSNFVSSTDFIYNIADRHYTMLILSKYILIISLIFSIFAILLLFNFIGLSILDNKKEIGILRALGTSKKDISIIYSIQGLLIGIVSYIISIFLIIWYSNIENNVIFNTKETPNILKINLAGINIQTLAIMMLFLLFIVILSVISTSNKISKMNPIDAINNK